MQGDGGHRQWAVRSRLSAIEADVDLAGIVLPDARNGTAVDLGAGPPLAILSIIRHRY